MPDRGSKSTRRARAGQSEGPSSKPLKRNTACLNCKYNKIKCDGVQPVCGTCTRTPRIREEGCEWPNSKTRSRVRDVEEENERLKSRIHELENPSMPSVFLLDPYAASPQSTRSSDTPSDNTESTLQNLPPGVIELLTNTCIQCSTRLGLFLDPQWLRDTVALPVGNANRAPNAIILTLCLLGTHFSPPQSPLRTHEPLFLRAALEAAATHSIDQKHHPQRSLHYVQFQILLAYYYFRLGEVGEARLHADSAASVVFDSGMEHTLSATHSTGSLSPSPLEDALMVGQRINGFWSLFITIRHLAISHSPRFSTVFDAPAVQVDTPWPLEMYQYQEGQLPKPGLAPIQTFLRSPMPQERDARLDSSLTKIAKSTIILHQATYLANVNDTLSDTYRKSHDGLCQLIDDYGRTLPSYSALDPQTAIDVYLCHALINGAEMRIHERFKEDVHQQQRAVAAAKSVFDIPGGETVQEQLAFVTPVLGDIWAHSCLILIDNATSPDISYDAARLHDLVRTLENGMSIMGRFAVENNVHLQHLLATVTHYREGKARASPSSLHHHHPLRPSSSPQREVDFDSSSLHVSRYSPPEFPMHHRPTLNTSVPMGFSTSEDSAISTGSTLYATPLEEFVLPHPPFSHSLSHGTHLQTQPHSHIPQPHSHIPQPHSHAPQPHSQTHISASSSSSQPYPSSSFYGEWRGDRTPSL